MYEEPTKFEKITGSLATRTVVTATAAVAAGSAVGLPFIAAAAVIPVLFDSLAGRRHRQRNENWVNDLTQGIEAKKEQFQYLKDEQYQLMNEVIGIASQTINPKKLEYLHHAVLNTIDLKDLASQQATLLGRLIRDISAHEADFVCQNFECSSVFVGEVPSSYPGVLSFSEHSSESLIVQGLVGLGVLEAIQEGNQFGSFEKGTYFRFSKVAAKLNSLLHADSTGTL